MLKDKFRQWNFVKNITKTVLPVLDQKMVQDATGHPGMLGPHGRPVNERRLRKYLRRKGWTPSSRLSVENQNLSTSGDSTSTRSTSHGEMRDDSSLGPKDASYEQDCPYRPWAKKFRFSETHPK